MRLQRLARRRQPGRTKRSGRTTTGRRTRRESATADHLFRRSPVSDYPVIDRARGSYVYDTEGHRYLDGCSGAVVSNIGHSVREVVEALTRQARRATFAHSSQFISEASLDLSRRIAELCPPPLAKDARVYLVSGGSEAVETAIKLARQYQIERGQPQRTRIISRWQSYHGSSLGALSVTGHRARRRPFEPLLVDFPHMAPVYCYRCPFDLEFPDCKLVCADDLERTLESVGPDKVAAFIGEPISGAALGAVTPPDGYWQRIREICDRYEVLLIADEVMTGVGRTGRAFALDHWSVIPDIIVMGKGLGAGYTPLGAVIARGFVHEAIREGSGTFEHGFTYSANPLSAATGAAVLKVVRQKRLISRARQLGPDLERLLRRAAAHHTMVGDVRGQGLLWGLELVRDRSTREPFDPALRVAQRLGLEARRRGLMLYPGSGSVDGTRGDHVIVAPPLTISRKDLELLGQLLDEALGALAASLELA
ncbi:MAG: aspartate aminotransferase family protein [Acidobacteriota bacterium]